MSKRRVILAKMNSLQDWPYISIVVIGYNEASNLEKVFEAIKMQNYPVDKYEIIYVDSGSVDSSVSIAEKYCNKIFVEKNNPSASKNRNRGFRESKSEFIHFVDGDTIPDSNYIQHAIRLMIENRLDVVFGMVVPTNKNFFNNILLHDYQNRKPGLIDAPGAGGTFRREALVAVNGWNENIPRGEETELGIRLRNQKYKIYYTDQVMGLHDYGINSIWHFFKKQYIEGRSLAHILRYGKESELYINSKNVARNNLYIHFLALIILVVPLYLGLIYLLILPISILIYFLYLLFRYKVIEKIKNKNTIKYFLISNLTRTFVLLGSLSYYLRIQTKHLEPLILNYDVEEVYRNELTDSELPDVSVVVIGKNEADNLQGAFESIINMDYPIEKIELIYVDTGSIDDSVEIAKKYTSKVFIEINEWPTAGLARNRGLLDAKNEFVHFLDGDIQIDKHYLKQIIPIFKEKNVQAAYGYLGEKSEKGINKLMLDHWLLKKEGLSRATGGGGTYLKSYLMNINGYDERIFKGQETELGVRFNSAGFHIWFAKIKMGIHNYGFNGFVSLYKFHYRQGMSLAYNSLLNVENTFFNNNNKMSYRNLLFNLGLFLALIISIVVHEIKYIPILIVAYLAFLFVKILVFQKVRRLNRINYLIMMNLFKTVVFLGQIEIYSKYFYKQLLLKQKYIKEKQIFTQ